jgi:ubiquinone/menaquinone biosynthesis C-methylase UbiE
MKPVDKLEFWKHRIEQAQREHYSVYITSEADWHRINKAHVSHFEKMNGRVLDAGCGYGRNSVYFSDYTGVDFSPDFIKLAKQKFPNKDFMVANLKELPFKDKEFDWAFCVSIKQMIRANLGEEEWLKMESELRRVAKQVMILEYEDPEPVEIL